MRDNSELAEIKDALASYFLVHRATTIQLMGQQIAHKILIGALFNILGKLLPAEGRRALLNDLYKAADTMKSDDHGALDAATDAADRRDNFDQAQAASDHLTSLIDSLVAQFPPAGPATT